MDGNSTSMAAAALILALTSLPPPPPPPPPVSLAAPCLDEDLLAIHRATGVDEDAARIQRALAVQNLQKPRPRPEIGGTRISKGYLFGLTDQECEYQFRMTAQNLIDLSEALQIEEVVTSAGSRFPAVEALGLLLARFKTAGDQYDLSRLYNRSQSSISECINLLVEFLDEKWEHLLACDSDSLLHPDRLAEYATAIRDQGSLLPMILGFIDCTIRRICNPTWFQRVAYNGHKKTHALKYQAVMLPNGIIGHLFGPFEGRRNDLALLQESQLLERLAQFAVPDDAPPDAPPDEQTFYVFGDPAYGLGPHMQSPISGPGDRTEEEQAFNSQMSAVRIEVEHGFGMVTNLWPFLNAAWKMKLYSSPVGRYYRIGVLLTNCLSCLRGKNQVATYFGLTPPSLDEYLHN